MGVKDRGCVLLAAVGYGERQRSAGVARAEIIQELVVKGFVRLRRYQRKMAEYWVVNFCREDEVTPDMLREFFAVITAGGFGYREEDSFIEIR